MAKKKNISLNASYKRERKLKEEIYNIMSQSAHEWFKAIESRDNTLTKRLNSMEQNGMPENAVEEIKKELSSLRYTVHKQTKVIESLIQFMGVSKKLFETESKG